MNKIDLSSINKVSKVKMMYYGAIFILKLKKKIMQTDNILLNKIEKSSKFENINKKSRTTNMIRFWARVLSQYNPIR